jgi:geranylgeranyl diphosphate synthase type II
VTAGESLAGAAERFRTAARELLETAAEMPASLRASMAYALDAPGKRFRPALVWAAGEWLGLSPDTLTPAATAVEMVHTYSLVHDDLPAMDNDDWRRGRATVHRVYGEALAILVGDALVTDAFRVLCRERSFFAAGAVLEAVEALSGAAGPSGMVGGQVWDLHQAPGLSVAELQRLHRAKTGALIRWAVEVPAILTGRTDARAALSAYGAAVGLAFQIADDILDVVGERAVTGKTPGRDAALGKTTYPVLFGIDRARQMARTTLAEAEGQVDGPRGETLRALARYVVDRNH